MRERTWKKNNVLKMAGKIWNVKQRFIKNGQVFLKDCFVFCIETKTKLPIFKTFFLQLFSKSVHITTLPLANFFKSLGFFSIQAWEIYIFHYLVKSQKRSFWVDFFRATILSSNQNHDPETCHFLFPFKKKKLNAVFAEFTKYCLYRRPFTNL